MDKSSFDYIICGGGTSGCLIASRLASFPDVTVLLVEAGRDSGVAPDVLVPGKYVHQLSADPEGLWQLPTVPQKELNDRELTFIRGKQLGGSSAVNYMALARGPAVDYDVWAKLTDDESWSWTNVLPLMKDLEDFDPRRPDGFKDFAKPKSSDHGVGGPIKVGFGETMVPGVDTFFQACVEVGMKVCPDNNSGDPVGVGLAQFNVGGGERILFEDHRAIGVDLFQREKGEILKIGCNKEVILCAGTFGSPQTLMLSGVGPRTLLENQGIPVVIDIPGVGQKMLDHSILSLEFLVDESILAHNQVLANAELLAEAETMYAKDKSGPLNMFGTSGTVAFPKLHKLLASREFQELEEDLQLFMLEETRPSAEIWLGSGPSAYAGDIRLEESYLTFELLLQNNLSQGDVALPSNDPRVLPVINPRFLEHPYDKRIAIETVRQALKVAEAAPYRNAIKRMVHGPGNMDEFLRSEDLEDTTILEFVRANLGQGYHSLGTCKMGPAGDPGRVVDADFKVVGVQGLRVADLSVCPILTCNHTQINTYLIGEKCSRAIIQEFSQAKNTRETKL